MSENVRSGRKFRPLFQGGPEVLADLRNVHCTIRGVEVHRCCRAQCPRSLSKPLTSARWYKETSGKKDQFRPDVATVQAHNRARRTHLPRILIQPVLPSRLSCSKTQARFGSPFDLQSAAAQLAQLPRACWKLESRVTTARKLPRACKFESRITTARRPWRFVRVGRVQL